MMKISNVSNKYYKKIKGRRIEMIMWASEENSQFSQMKIGNVFIYHAEGYMYQSAEEK